MTLAAMLFSTQLTYAQVSILLVNDNGYDMERVEVIKEAITNAGYDYTYYDAVTEASAPSLEMMNGFDLLVWYTGNDGGGLYFWDGEEGEETDNENLISYLNDGGMLWLQGLDFLYDRYPEVPTVYAEGDFVYDYLGIAEYHAQSHLDDGFYSDGVPQFDVVADNGIFEMTPLLWAFSTMWYADALAITDNASGLYTMGPAEYDFSDYYGVVYNEVGDAKIITTTTETARFDSQENIDAFMGEGLAYFEQFGSGAGIPVEEITVSSEGDVTEITEDGASLQLYAAVLPEDADNKVVTWSIGISSTAVAGISNDGLLTATGTIIGNGNCWVLASAIDGSGVVDSLEIIITNQENNTDFEVLLVNDNANGTDRYLELDTVLYNIDANYEVYNTLETGTAPDIVLLSNYDLVIWYTGNDGVNLKLWDVSDTNNYKFNADLMSYIEMKGNIWIQGLDFMYAIEGGAPVDYEAGQFIYDVMGISKYAAQSKVDDGDMGVPQLDVVEGNGASEVDPIMWTYTTMYFVDGFEVTSSAHPQYKMGPVGYPLDMYYSALFKHDDTRGIIMTWAFETARIDSRPHAEDIFYEVLNYIEDHSETAIQEWENDLATIDAIYPNPATYMATLNYQLLNNAEVQFNLLDITGKSVYFKNYGSQTVGNHQISINRNKMNVQQGVYLYTITIDNQQYTGKVIFN